ncbi:MAG TPA: hypothetical protein VHO66_05570 [Ruminiclostridium sp.]|nr:hypothetical protein [Ruminiclostridium sp.]
MKDYFIPHNFKDNGKIAGIFEKRNFYLALFFFVPAVLLLVFTPLPLPINKAILVKVFVFIIVLCPPTILTSLGYSDILFFMHDFNKRKGVYKKNSVDNPKSKFKYSDFFSVKRIVKGNVQLSDGNYVRILEIEPVNFKLKSNSEKEGIILGFQEFLKSLGLDFEITVLTQKADTMPYIEMLNNKKKEEKDANIKTMIGAYADFVGEMQEHGAVTRKFILSYTYKPKYTGKAKNAETPLAVVDKYFIDMDERIKEYLTTCGNRPITADDVDFKIAQILNSAFCRKNDDFEPIDSSLWGKDDYLDAILPDEIDVTNPGYIKVDNKFISTIVINTIPYYIQSGFLEDLVCFGEGVNVNIYYRYSNPAQVSKDINMAIGYTKVKRKHAGENQNDIDTIDNCLDHAKYIRKKMSENEKLYYVSIIVSVCADDAEELEQRLQNVEAKVLSKTMECRRADFLQSRAYIRTLPLNIL